MNGSLKDLVQVVKEFLGKHLQSSAPLLVGYSGGPDSKALLHALLMAKMAPLHIAHVDHGWREESQAEAALLQIEAQRLEIPFHFKRLACKTNEAEARLERLIFFRTLQEKLGCAAVLLAHHADDLAETVLKRIFEGARLTQLAPMHPVSVIEQVTLWRPFLALRRSEIERWLSHNHLSAFQDPSNRDPRYLRSRMRYELIPYLETVFGKGICTNLGYLAERSHELNLYLSKTSDFHGHRVVKRPFGWCLDCEGIERVELRHLLQRMAAMENFSFSRPVLDQLLHWIGSGCTNRRIMMAGRKIVVDRKHFFLLTQKKLDYKKITSKKPDA